MTQIDEQDTTSIDEQIRDMLFNWHKWRDYYYSDLQEQVITDDEWEVTRDKIDYDAIEKIKALISDQVAKARIETIDYYSWRFECNTGVSEMYGWRNTLERAKDQTLRHFEATLNGVKNR